MSEAVRGQPRVHAVSGGRGNGRTRENASSAGVKDRSSRPGGSAAPRPRSYEMGEILGNGSFGIVCQARCIDDGQQVAIKKVLQDPRYKNRELDIMHELHHPNIVELKDYFYTEADDRDGEHNRFLNVVMEHIPDTVYKVMKTYIRSQQSMPLILVKLYTYQMCRALGYLHTLGVCHRDIKPQNLLVDSRSHVLKLCDFGSAKRLVEGEHSVAYICSRFYRAPELMLGATEYTTAIDIWSIGCVLGELLLGRPLFAGETSVDQLVKIIQILGTPSRRQMQAMNPNYTEFRFPDVRPREWKKVFYQDTPDAALDLLSLFLKYEPAERLHPLEALSHEFFDEIRGPNIRLPSGGSLPELFSFSDSELWQMSTTARTKCIPEWLSKNSSSTSSSNEL